MKTKKVAMVLSTNINVGGGYQYALLMAECLKELTDSRYELLAICTNRSWCGWCRSNRVQFIMMDWIPYTEKQAERNLRFPLYSQIYNTYMTELGKTIRKEKIDLLFVTEQLMFIPNLNVKIIAPVHDLMHRYESSFPEVQSDYGRRELLLRCQAKNVDYILVDSKLGRAQFRESYLETCKKIPHIVSLPFVVPTHIVESREEYIKTPAQYVFYPAQFWKHKNHINLIKAIKILKGSIENIHLILAGSEKNNCKEIREYIFENQLENNITILGFVSNENITYLYRHAVGLIMPSYFGPTNIPPLEAMALGCPVAVSNKYAMPEQVGKAGLLFDPDSPEEIAVCIRRLWTEPELRKEMIDMGYRQIRKWTKREFKAKVLKVLERSLQCRNLQTRNL